MAGAGSLIQSPRAEACGWGMDKGQGTMVRVGGLQEGGPADKKQFGKAGFIHSYNQKA